MSGGIGGEGKGKGNEIGEKILNSGEGEMSWMEERMEIRMR